MKRAAVLSLAAVSAVLACQSDRSIAPNPATGRLGISAALVDGGHGGNPHFFFLPPMVPPPPPRFSGVFDRTQTPDVAICTVQTNGSCPEVAHFTTPPPGTLFNPSQVFSRVQVIGNLQFYFVLWRPNWLTLDPTQIQRLRVSVGTQTLGLADIKVVSSEDQFEAVWASKQFVPLIRRGLLLIIFRIEQGAVGAGPPGCNGQRDCTQVTVGPNPTQRVDVVTPSGQAAASFPEGYFKQTVTLTIHQVLELGEQGCFSASTPPRPSVFGCYSYATSPPQVDDALGCRQSPSAATCARVEVCPTLGPADPRQQHLQLFRSDPAQAPRSLEGEVEATLITCPPLNLGLGAHGITNLVHRSWRSLMTALGGIVRPKSLFAATGMIHLGHGGLTCCFSNIGWALPLTLSTVPGTDHNTAAPGTRLVPDPAVLLQYVHPSPSPASGLTVNFVVAAGGGTIGSASAITGSNGSASVPWTVGSGTNLLVATADSASGSPDTITAKGEAALIDCPPVPGGDLIDRGFFVPNYQSVSLNRVDLYFLADAPGAGTYAITLMARTGAYDGPVIGASTSNVTVTGDRTQVQTTFNFPANVVTPGSTVAFAISGGPAASFFFAVGACDFSSNCVPSPSCPVIETESATAGVGQPLDTFRRNGISVRIFGDPTTP